MNKKW
jgi:hypothetical protein